MPDTKISAMTAAVGVLQGDLVPIVSSGANFRATKTQLLTAFSTDPIFITSNAGDHAGYDTINEYVIQQSSGKSITIGNTALGFLQIDASGNLTLGQDAPGVFTIDHGAGTTLVIAGDGTFTIDNSVSGKPVHIPYTPLAPGDWAGSPTEVWEAIDRIAAVVSSGGASPIP